MNLRAATPTPPDAVLVVFAKAPRPGKVKTRLVPLLGAREAARLHARLVERALQTAIAARCGTVELHCAPRLREPFFARLARRYGVALRAQTRGDLGTRMHCALSRGLRVSHTVVLIGADCPALQPRDLRAAVRALHSGVDAVFSPAEDGGYALIGARRVSRRLFDGIPWGDAAVMAATRARLRALGWRWRELRTVWDVDRPRDYARLERAQLLRETPVLHLPRP